MTIDFELYLLKKPDFSSQVIKQFGMEHDPEYPVKDYKAYRWKPIKNEHHLWVYENTKPSIAVNAFYLMDGELDGESLASKVNELRMNNHFIPYSFIKKLRKDKGEISADQTLYSLLEQYPKLSRMFPELEPVWGVVRESHGAPVYQVSFEAKAYSSVELLAQVCRLARFMASAYKGLLWNEETREFGFPDVEKIQRNYSEAMGDLGFIAESKGAKLIIPGEKEEPEQPSDKCKIIPFPLKSIKPE
ncbi:MAG: hypothetical protein KKE20_06035 [Nanoarchaeota archaeon]|nr:hypothetical protein [Nanoarchaeota archaeon]